jgi:TfoX/Sxy family transcriptional regulator of competence genes
MATMPKASEDDREYFRSLVPDDPRVEVKPMFGSLGAFVNGRMFLGLFGSAVGVKLDDAGRSELLAEDGAGPFGPTERPMGGYVALPPAWRASPGRAAPWVERALAQIGALPPKEPGSRRSRAKGTG